MLVPITQLQTQRREKAMFWAFSLISHLSVGTEHWPGAWERRKLNLCEVEELSLGPSGCEQQSLLLVCAHAAYCTSVLCARGLGKILVM